MSRYPFRVMDFPPDETSIMGIGVGYSQAGLLPIVEMPYAKYLDCGADMFCEAAIANWLSNGNSPNGMIVRLQVNPDGSSGYNDGRRCVTDILLCLSDSHALMVPNGDMPHLFCLPLARYSECDAEYMQYNAMQWRVRAKRATEAVMPPAAN